VKQKEKNEIVESKSKAATIWVVVIISIVYFAIFWIPNSAASEDFAMVEIFEPDEGMPLPYVLDMIEPAESVFEAIRNFVFYQYYFYGFPHFAYSAVSILPVKLLGEPEANIPVVMTLLRQLVSVLPLLLSSILLVYMQTGFKSLARSILLLLLLLAIPAVTRNNYWWHPDGLSILFITLTIFFLHKDNLSFGKFYFIAALICGISIGIKQNGAFFFLAIAVYLLWGLFSNRINFKKAALLGFAFITIMFAGFILSNPLLLLPTPRERYLVLWNQLRHEITTGYEVHYAKGIQTAGPTLLKYFGNWVFLSLALFAPIIGIIRNRNRLLNVMILSWALALGIYVIFFTLVKFQYVLPFALPLISCMWIYFPNIQKIKDVLNKKEPRKILWQALTVFGAVIIVFQFFNHIQWNITSIKHRTQRAETSASIKFYQKVEQHLEPLIDQELLAYRDVRLYIPDSSTWDIFYRFQLLDYATFEEADPEVILLMQQRIYDYLNPEVTGINPGQLEISRVFYRDADEGNLEGYTLIFRDDFGLAFVRNDIYQDNFE
jgi:hypothetical protein